MKHLHRLRRSVRSFSARKKILVPVVTVLIIGIGSLAVAFHTSSASASPEVQFTDASRSGLAIVPASGASDPYTCYSSGPHGQSETCTCTYGGTYPSCTIPCPAGYSGTYPNCVAPTPTPNPTPPNPGCSGSNCNTPVSNPTCPSGDTGTYPECLAPGPGSSCPTGYGGSYPNCTGPVSNPPGSCMIGYTQNGNDCTFTGCPLGYVQQGNSCTFTGCPLGYTQQGAQCIFTSCPSGYVDNGSHTCIRYCTPQYLCGTDQNLYHEDASCNITASPVQTCGYGCSGSECLPPPAPVVVTFSVSPNLVKSGSTATITWNVQNVSGCSITGTNGDGPWTGSSGTKTSATIIGQVIYTLHCGVISGSQNADGSAATWTDQNDTVNIAPTYQEK